MDSLVGYEIRVVPLLAGSKHGWVNSRTIFLSPAMYDLVSHAEGECLRKLLAQINLRRIPDIDFGPPVMPQTIYPRPPDAG